MLDQIQKEIESGEYDQYIKTECFICGREIPGTIEHYAVHGNACPTCCGFISKAHKYKYSPTQIKNGLFKHH